jgi:hypothetical protein
VEQEFALFAAGMGGEHFAAELADILKPGAEVVGELLVDFAAKTLGEGGALSGSGDGDLEIAAGDDGAEEKVAVGNVVHTVAEDIALKRAGIDGQVDGGHVGCRDDDEVAVEIGKRKGAFDERELSFKS